MKAAMLKSSQTLAANPKLSLVPPSNPGSLGIRKARSTESLDSTHFSGGGYGFSDPPPHTGGSSTATAVAISDSPRVSAHHPSSVARPRSPRKSTHARGVSIDVPRLFSRSQVQLPLSTSQVDLSTSNQFKHGKDRNTSSGKSISPTKFVSILTGSSSLELDIELIKKLRLLLRNESAA